MNPDRSRIPMRSPRSAIALMSLALLVVSSAARAQTADAGKSRVPSGQAGSAKSVEEPPVSAPAKGPVASAPDEQKAPAVPLPSSTSPASSTWSLPTILMWCAAGVELVGLAFASGGHIAVMGATEDMEEAVPNMRAWGCGGDLGACGRFREAYSSVETAYGVGVLGFAFSTAIASGLALASAVTGRLEPAAAPAKKDAGVSVQVAPGPGGMVIQGTF